MPFASLYSGFHRFGSVYSTMYTFIYAVTIAIKLIYYYIVLTLYAPVCSMWWHYWLLQRSKVCPQSFVVLFTCIKVVSNLNKTSFGGVFIHLRVVKK